MEINFEIKIPKFKLDEELKFKLRIAVSFLIIAGVFAAKQNYEFAFVDALILIYFGISILWNLTNQIAAAAALFFLVCAPFLQIYGNNDLAETFAIYAYYFLVIVVAQELIYFRETKQVKQEKKQIKNLSVDNPVRQARRKIV